MLDLGLFRSAQFSTGIVSGIGSYLVMFGVLLLVPFYLERGLGLGTARSGLELMAMPLAFGIVAPLAGRLADRVGARPLTVGGMALVAGRLALMGAAAPGYRWVLGAAGGGRGRDGTVHLAQQRLDHGRRARAAGRHGLGRAEHDPRHGDGPRPRADRDRLRRRRRRHGARAPAQHAFSVTSYVLAAIAGAAGVVSAVRSNGALADTALSSLE